MGQKKRVAATGELFVTYVLTNTLANVPGLVVTAPEDGYYTVNTMHNFRANGAADDIISTYGINSVPQNVYAYSAPSTAGEDSCIGFSKSNVWLNAGDVVSLMAYYSVAGGDMLYAAAVRVSYFEIIKE